MNDDQRYPASTPPTFLGSEWTATDLDGMAPCDLNDVTAIFCDGMLLATIDAPQIDRHLAGGCVLLMAAAPELRQRLMALAQLMADGDYPEPLARAQRLAEDALTYLSSLPVPVTLDDAETLIDPDRV